MRNLQYLVIGFCLAWGLTMGSVEQLKAQNRPGFRDANAGRTLYNSRNIQRKTTFRDRLQAHTGGFMQFFPVYIVPPQGQPVEAFSFPPMYYGVNIGGQYEFWNKNDFISASVNPAMNVSLSYSNWAGLSFMWQMPIFATFRIGSNCTRYNQNNFGGGVGLGVVSSYILLPYRAEGGPPQRISQFFASPAIMAELNFGKRVNRYSIRFHMDLLPFSSKLRVEEPNQPPLEYKAQFRNFGIGFMYYFR